MKVAIDSGPLTGGDSVRGVGVYTKSLVSELTKLKGLKVDVVDFRIADFDNYDLVHYPYFKPYFTKLPIKRQNRVVVTIHDLTPLIYPKHYPPGVKGRFKLQLQKVMLGRVDAVITVSETSKKDIVRLLGIPNNKIYVTYEAPREIFKKIEDKSKLDKVKAEYKLPDKFVLYVGDVNYNKNLPGLAEACIKVGVSLVIAGKQAKNENVDFSHMENMAFKNFLDKYGNNDNVLRLGFVEDNDLVAIYNLASIYCQPSFYEGFGLPVLEAFASETPVVISRTQALVEVAGDAAMIADLKKTDDLAKKIKKTLEDAELRIDLIQRGKIRVKKFGLDKCAKETYQIYKKVVSDNA